MLFVGIDPGATGALVGITPEMKVELIHPFDGWKSAFDCMRNLSQTQCAVLFEKVGNMPREGKQGGNSIFTFGKNTGGWVSLLEGFRIPYEEVPPQKWQKSILGSIPAGTSKARALEFARKRFPTLDLKYAVSNGKQQGIVDALCMAVYIRAKYYQDNPGAFNKE